ncbi:SEL1-like repeat protein, partial [Acinetobacter lwoffii]
MKKLVLATVLALSAQFALANTVKDQVDPQFQKVEAMVKANNFKGAYDALNQLASQGNAQALYNLGYLTQTGQGTTKDEKKAIQLYEQAA